MCSQAAVPDDRKNGGTQKQYVYGFESPAGLVSEVFTHYVSQMASRFGSPVGLLVEIPRNEKGVIALFRQP